MIPDLMWRARRASGWRVAPALKSFCLLTCAAVISVLKKSAFCRRKEAHRRRHIFFPEKRPAAAPAGGWLRQNEAPARSRARQGASPALAALAWARGGPSGSGVVG